MHQILRAENLQPFQPLFFIEILVKFTDADEQTAFTVGNIKLRDS